MNNDLFLDRMYYARLEGRDLLAEEAETERHNQKYMGPTPEHMKISWKPRYSYSNDVFGREHVSQNPEWELAECALAECALDDSSLQELRDETKKLFLENLDKLDTEIVKKINDILKGVIS